MEFIVKCKIFKKAAAKVSHRLRGQTSKCVIPLKIKVVNNFVNMSANSFEINIEAQTLSFGRCVLDSRFFLEVLETYSDNDSLSIKVNKSGMLINGFSMHVDKYTSISEKQALKQSGSRVIKINKLLKKNIRLKKSKSEQKNINSTSTKSVSKEKMSDLYFQKGIKNLDYAKQLKGIIRYTDKVKAYEVIAWDWFQKAADSGNHFAEIELGKLSCRYGKEEDGREWHCKAAEGFRKEAAKGNPLGEYGLGEIYFNGYSVPPDKNEAEKWYQKARENKQRSV